MLVKKGRIIKKSTRSWWIHPRKEEAVEYKEEDLVWVDGSNINTDWPTDWPTKKLSFKRAGLFPVVKRIRSSAYELKILKMWKSLHPIINESKLKLYHHPTFPQQQETSLTLITLSQESTTQEAEWILDSRRRGSELEYLIQWKGQPFEESTWEDRQEVIRGAAWLCQDQEFHRSHPDAPGIPTIRTRRELYNEVASSRP